jgi:hypothetical protein
MIIDLQKNWLIGNCRDRPAYLAVRRKSDCQSDLHLAVRHGKSQRTKEFRHIPKGCHELELHGKGIEMK